MLTERPDLTNLPLEVLRYIQALETEIETLRASQAERAPRAEAALRTPAMPRPAAALSAEAEDTSMPSEPPTTFTLVTATASGIMKRTPRHLYDRQRRGGMGVFDLDAPDNDLPAFLTVADAGQTLIVFTTLGRAFPVVLGQLPESPVRARGESIRKAVPLNPDEKISLITPNQGAGHLTVVTNRGQVRRWRYNQLGSSLAPGTSLFDVRKGGAPVAACWSAANADLFIVTAKGLAIRFAEVQVAQQGSLGLRVDPDDTVVGVASVRPEDGIFMLASDGKGTVRQMAGLALNKAPGSGGKQAMKADRVVGATLARPGDDIFAISGLGKIIRFAVNDVPAKEGAVQGVNCMTLRNDQCVAVVAAGMAVASDAA